jgi:hypothetical protein
LASVTARIAAIILARTCTGSRSLASKPLRAAFTAASASA